MMAFQQFLNGFIANKYILSEKIMKTKTRNQLIGVIIGTAIGLGVNMIPGLRNGQEMFVLAGCILIIPHVHSFLMKTKNSYE